MIRVIGIDPGNKGGRALLVYDGREFESLITTEFDTGESRIWIQDAPPIKLDFSFGSEGERAFFSKEPHVLGFEDVGGVPGQSTRASFNFGYTTGWQECLTHQVFDIKDTVRVRPMDWKRAMMAVSDGTPGVSTKEFSRRAMCKWFAGILDSDSVNSLRHDGVIDALLIAEYTRRLSAGYIK